MWALYVCIYALHTGRIKLNFASSVISLIRNIFYLVYNKKRGAEALANRENLVNLKYSINHFWRKEIQNFCLFFSINQTRGSIREKLFLDLLRNSANVSSGNVRKHGWLDHVLGNKGTQRPPWGLLRTVSKAGWKETGRPPRIRR